MTGKSSDDETDIADRVKKPKPPSLVSLICIWFSAKDFVGFKFFNILKCEKENLLGSNSYNSLKCEKNVCWLQIL